MAHHARRLEDALQSKWMQDASEEAQQARVRVNVGGQVFETTKAVLCKEPESRLAAVAAKFLAQVVEARDSARAADTGTSPTGSAEDTAQAASAVPALSITAEGGAATTRFDAAEAVEPPFFDRDWWLFRYILQCLREGAAALPQDRSLLKQLFSEAGFWRLTALQEDIRTLYMRLAAREADAEASLGASEPPPHQVLAQVACMPPSSRPMTSSQALQATQPWPAELPSVPQPYMPIAPGAPVWQPSTAPPPGSLRPGVAPQPQPSPSPYWNYAQSQPWPTHSGPSSTPYASTSAPTGLAAKAAMVGYTPPTDASAWAARPQPAAPGSFGGRPPLAGGTAAQAGLSSSQGWPTSAVPGLASGLPGSVSRVTPHSSAGSAML